ncbi:ribonuclease H-like domain-containing protein [Tanacetum coccineum]
MVSSPSGDRNKIYDPGICIEVKSKRFLAPLSPVIDNLLPFSSENEDKIQVIDGLGNMSYLTDFEEIDGGYVAFGGNPKGGKITSKVPRKNNMYSVDLKNIVPKGGLTCLFAKATFDEFKLWCDNGTEFKNKEMNQFYDRKGIKREFSVTRTPQQNGVAKRKNRTLIEAARIMLADSKLPTTFWAEAINTACYVQNRVLVTKPHNKTPYELFLGRKPALGFMRPFGCPVTILNTLDHLGKFDGKADERFFVGSGPNCLFDIDALTKIMNYKLVITRNQSNSNASIKACDDVSKSRMETVPGKDYILLPLWPFDPPFSQSSKSSPDVGFKPSGDDEKKVTEEPGKEDGDPIKEGESEDHEEEDDVNSTNNINTVNLTVNVADTDGFNAIDENIIIRCVDDPNMPELEKIGRFSDAKDDNSGVDMNNLDTYF